MYWKTLIYKGKVWTCDPDLSYHVNNTLRKIWRDYLNTIIILPAISNFGQLHFKLPYFILAINENNPNYCISMTNHLHFYSPPFHQTSGQMAPSLFVWIHSDMCSNALPRMSQNDLFRIEIVYFRYDTNAS